MYINLIRWLYVLYVKPFDKRFIFLQRNIVFLASLSGESIELHPALCVHHYMARANDVNNTESH